ncbi:MAG: GNAT family N-acetyltransferase [Chitinophagaceae bacterium]|nr:GNAT family N-acetyltransferase [Chitinophagaceae bacterium]
MISVKRATAEDHRPIVAIGKIAVAEAHRDSTSAENLNEYLEKNYNDHAIKEELDDPDNIYHMISYNGNPVGFSKIILNAKEPGIVAENVTKLDRIYLLKEFYGLKLGLELMNFNIRLAVNNKQSGIWLYTWIGNTRAIDFYLKRVYNYRKP